MSCMNYTTVASWFQITQTKKKTTTKRVKAFTFFFLHKNSLTSKMAFQKMNAKTGWRSEAKKIIHTSLFCFFSLCFVFIKTCFDCICWLALQFLYNLLLIQGIKCRYDFVYISVTDKSDYDCVCVCLERQTEAFMESYNWSNRCFNMNKYPINNHSDWYVIINRHQWLAHAI